MSRGVSEFLQHNHWVFPHVYLNTYLPVNFYNEIASVQVRTYASYTRSNLSYLQTVSTLRSQYNVPVVIEEPMRPACGHWMGRRRSFTWRKSSEVYYSGMWIVCKLNTIRQLILIQGKEQTYFEISPTHSNLKLGLSTLSRTFPNLFPCRRRYVSSLCLWPSATILRPPQAPRRLASYCS